MSSSTSTFAAPNASKKTRPSWKSPDDGSRQVPVRDLKVGAPADCKLTDASGLLLAPRGMLITEQFVEQLRRRGLMYVTMRGAAGRGDDAENEAPPAAGPATSPAKNRRQANKRPPFTEGFGELIPASFDPAKLPRLGLRDLRVEAERGREMHRAGVLRYASLSRDMLRGEVIDTRAAREIILGLDEVIHLDPVLGMLVMDLKSDEGEHLYRHGMNVAALSMTVAMYLGFDHKMVQETGVAALVSDVGMFRVPPAIRLAPRRLSPDEQIEIRKHPNHTLSILERARALSRNGLLIASQVHERCDGSGYPLRRSRQFIHPLARIVAVADTFIAMTSPRQHRRGKYLHYDAMVTILRERTRLDRTAARAFIDCMSLFPVGSIVELSDGHRAEVVRGNGPLHTRPVVAPLNADGLATDEELDLSRCNGLHVVEVRGGQNATLTVPRRAGDFRREAAA